MEERKKDGNEIQETTQETKLPLELPLPEAAEKMLPPPEPASPEKKDGLLKKIVSGAISALFCAVALIFMITESVDCADRLVSGKGLFLINEVMGKVEEETEIPEEPDVPDVTEPDTAPAAPEEADEPATPEIDDLTHPVAYESLANYDLMTDLSNETAYSPDLASLLSKKSGVGRLDEIYKTYGEDAPVVLIVHTHGTEAYSNGGLTYSENDSFRTDDTNCNVVAVGEVMANVLESAGIHTIHCREMFDRESYRESYSRSYSAVADYLKEYPSVSYVIDIHRDSVFREDKTNIATYAEVDGLPAAQAMIVVGTDEGGANHPDWMKNLSFALTVQEGMISLSESVPRKINLRCAAFNQALCPGSILFEIGSCANTLTEAKRSATVAALALSRAVRGDDECGDLSEALKLFAS